METAAGERRVALVPESIPKFKGFSILVEKEAGDNAGYADSAYTEKGAAIASDSNTLYGQSDIILKVQPPSPEEADLFKEGATLVSFLYPLSNIESVKRLAARHATVFAIELLPRISRSQSMDVLSSQANVAGYKAVMIAADSLPKMFPLMMTAAGTISPAKVFVIGAGVAGLQAIATAHRLGAVVEAYDVRPAVKEQITSLGAKFVELRVEAKDAQTAGGYAKAQSDEFYKKQQELLAEHTRQADVVITTALVPGKRAPILVSEDAVKGMRTGSVVVDLAAEQGGNCALTEPGKTVVKYGVTIHGTLNVPSSMAPQTSQLFSRNLAAFLGAMIKDGGFNIDLKDEIVKGTLVMNKGEILNETTKSAIAGESAK
ncbi:MAG: Re/Si-specific NAD(P)(+) transhydrogenase subunit alpha [Nitrososphaerota archaeon]|nr:Re/Si-specific NAD(P)(+) transhydrogenase subunit alpha [Nitrososphaerota archaeon]